MGIAVAHTVIVRALLHFPPVLLLKIDGLTALDSVTYMDEHGNEQSAHDLHWLLRDHKRMPGNLRIVLCTLVQSIESQDDATRTMAWDALQRYSKATDNVVFVQTYQLSQGDRVEFCKQMLSKVKGGFL